MYKFSSRKSPLARSVRMEAARRGIEMRAVAKEALCSRAALYQCLGECRMGPTEDKLKAWLAKSRRRDA